MTALSAATPLRLPDDARVPSMLTDAELDHLFTLAARDWTGAGRVVELGAYLGGSTAALVEGMTRNPRGGAPLLTYDAFVMDEWSNAFLPTPYRPGESFRPLFEVFQRDRLDRITIREGRLPEDPDGRALRALYPEQEPVEILFVDLAKTWSVHLTVLRCFGPHLIPGQAKIVQQDFKDPLTYWLPLHMHRLRGSFEPIADIARSSTVTFRYRGGIEDGLGEFERHPACVPEIDAEWDEIERWLALEGSEMPDRLRLQRLAHHFARGQFDRASECVEHFASTFDPARSGAAAAQVAHAWRTQLDVMAWQLARLPGVADAVRDAVRRARAEALPGEMRAPAWATEHGGTPWPPFLLWDRLWRAIAERCHAAGWRRLALYGAGHHTRKLLASGFPHGPARVVAILDDGTPVDTIAGIPVIPPEAIPADVDAVLLSSDACEPALARRAEAVFARDLPVVRVYTE